MSSRPSRTPEVVLVTGAASGMGRAVAERLSRTARQLILWDLNEGALADVARALTGSNVRTMCVNVADENAVRDAFDALARDGLVPAFVFHAAGILRTGGLDRVTVEDCRRTVDVNYMGTVHLLLNAARVMTAGGQIFCISSVAGIKGFPEFPAYAASKHAVVGFCEAIRGDLLKRGIHLSVLCPPAVDTPMVQNLGYRPAMYDLFPFAEKDDVVERVVALVGTTGRFIILVDAQTRLLRRVNGLIPETTSWLFDRLVDRFHARTPRR